MSENQIDDAPVMEMAISVSTAGGDLIDAYDVRGTHDHFRTRFPNASRAPSFQGIEPFPEPGSMVAPQQAQFLPFTGTEPNRWWFESEGHSHLLQVQENFVARNWRRINLPPDAPAEKYPGYEALKADFTESITILRDQAERDNRAFPTPSACELLYDNMIYIGDENSQIRIKDVLPIFQFSDGYRRYGINTSWVQVDPTWTGENSLQIQTNISGLGAQVAGQIRSFLRVMFVARTAIDTWDAVPDAFDTAHVAVTKLLPSLTGGQVRANWSQ
ncbi:TIGR04255 family protein [Caulobacter sp. BE254]|uniref:TIGR04255 family protein n=1 Tax=Caulobacter sp. BE254 TaxID=2817720 RepID=UPI002857926E|nr:TIGR04255 family protein [Caulobacter sp. BE254]MDR7118395.1 uncharacterized protein (TIGR04255 family) [Caulobacter sp. BE254]